MNFIKMQAQGNDFIIIKDKIIHPKEFAVRFCDRHFGIGADGLVILYPTTKADIGMKIYNADGSRAEICGSALRCVASLYLKEKKTVVIKTDAGLKEAFFIEDNLIKINIGKPKFVVSKKIEINMLLGYYVSVGNPHFVIFVRDLNNVEDFVYEISENRIFKRGINIEFVEILDKYRVRVRVFERGVGETLACGTGASAIQFVGSKVGLLDNKLKILFPGGEVFTEIYNDSVYLSGKTALVFKGEVNL